MIACIACLAWMGYGESKTYYHTILELQTLDSAARSHRIRVGGTVEPGSIRRYSGRVEFVLEGEGKTLPGYIGTDPLPDTLVDKSQALVEGHTGPEGRFVAEVVQAKCASKYEAALQSCRLQKVGEWQIACSLRTNQVMVNDLTIDSRLKLLVGLLAGSIFVCSALTHASQGSDKTVAAQPAAAAATSSPAPRATAPLPVVGKSQRGAEFYKRRWGIDNVIVRATASGELIRFSYRIVDAKKAALINDKAKTPYLIEEKLGVALQIPQMEKVGQLRQTAKPENGREYWMAFSNKGKLIKPGNRVDIVIGSFRINDLVVE